MIIRQDPADPLANARSSMTVLPLGNLEKLFTCSLPTRGSMMIDSSGMWKSSELNHADSSAASLKVRTHEVRNLRMRCSLAEYEIPSEKIVREAP